MIKHVVMYKFKHDIQKIANMVKAKKMFQELEETVKWVDKLEVGMDFNHVASSYDLCFYATFKTKENLMWFKSEPEHLEVQKFLKEVVEEFHVVEYEVEDESMVCRT